MVEVEIAYRGRMPLKQLGDYCTHREILESTPDQDIIAVLSIEK